ncbi:class C beta-lactamase [Phyllobacterium myrsinacearum]|uniref:Beta-lactamase n=1 Tax=Phyllobacterium myrsinacearum TaxID=28101 RepID=A0A839EGL1_9HYPH|nr:class C beta-lactamase [Phyllobacterium myrsinacearum]MBA8876724.1 beta-lactamase class C [Phyllobacterium myrsinacearum]
MISKATRVLTCVLLATATSTIAGHAANEQGNKVRTVVDAAIRPMMEKYNIPGMAVGITVDGKPYIFDYGIASKETGIPVKPDTLFEIGSISKTFVATLASLAQANGQLSLSDKTSKYLPSMQGTAFGDVSLLHLGTHTPGGFPLQVPDDVKDDAQMMRYFQTWKPAYKAGAYRTYANPSIGMLGFIAAKAMNKDFAALMEGDLFPALGLTSTYIDVPESKMAEYAQGYTRKDEPARVSKAVLSSEAYGVKTTATDLIHFVEANMAMHKLGGKLQQAITDTHTGYFKVGPMTQDLIWEQYAYPVDLNTLQQSNSSDMLKPISVTAITPPQAPRDDVLINKTGSTNGFGGYVAFVPEKRLGIVILANKNYPNEDRVRIAHEIFSALGTNE